MPKNKGPKDEGGAGEPEEPSVNEELPPLEDGDPADDAYEDERSSESIGERFVKRGLNDADMNAVRDFQRRMTSALAPPAFAAFREQQRRMANIVTRSIVRLLQQQHVVTPRFNVSAIKALEAHQRRLNLLVSAPMMRAIEQQQRALAELTAGPAFESFRHSQLQMAKLASSPAVQALAKQQVALSTPATTRLQKTLSSTAFQKSYLTQVHAFTEAVSKVQLDPGWRVAVQSVRNSPEVDRWADLVANAVEAGPSSSSTAMEEATEAVAGSKAIREALSQAAEADTEPLEELIEIAARALDVASQAEEGDADSDPLVDRADADTYRALLKIWGVGNVVAIVVLACIVSGQTFVILGSLAALAQLTGYSVKDLIRFLRDSDGDNE